MTEPNPLASECPCKHPAYLHDTLAKRAEDLANGRQYVALCHGRLGGGTTGACCMCQVDRAAVINAAWSASTP